MSCGCFLGTPSIQSYTRALCCYRSAIVLPSFGHRFCHRNGCSHLGYAQIIRYSAIACQAVQAALKSDERRHLSLKSHSIVVTYPAMSSMSLGGIAYSSRRAFPRRSPVGTRCAYSVCFPVWSHPGHCLSHKDSDGAQPVLVQVSVRFR